MASSFLQVMWDNHEAEQGGHPSTPTPEDLHHSRLYTHSRLWTHTHKTTWGSQAVETHTHTHPEQCGAHRPGHTHTHTHPGQRGVHRLQSAWTQGCLPPVRPKQPLWRWGTRYSSPELGNSGCQQSLEGVYSRTVRNRHGWQSGCGAC